MTAPRWVLDRTPPVPAGAPALDPAQRRVVDHPGGPLLVLAGPGTGKTTTLVEAVVERVERRELTPDRVLVLTFSRRAADELRERVAARLGRTVSEPSAHTFHSWCYALLRAWPDEPGALPPRLLSGAERELRVRELLAGHAAGEGRVRWPEVLRPALPVRGFARELADLVDRARERGLDGAGLAALGRDHDRPAWEAAGRFLAEHEEVLRLRGELDYAGLIGRAHEVLERPDVREAVRERYAAVLVDEYQDTDPAQEALLQQLAGGGRDLVAVGDPDQSVYGFRGADVEAIRAFPDRFRTAGGAPAPVVALRTCRRTGAEVLAPSRVLAARLPARDAAAGHRDLVAAGPPGRLPEVRLFATAADEAVAVADLLRRSRLEEGVPWERMAVLVRSGVRSLPPLRRALAGAGVPVAVASDEVAVADDPVVQPLLVALRLADAAARGATPPVLEPDAAESLLLSPLGAATPRRLRALGRALRAARQEAGLPELGSAVLLRDAVLHGAVDGAPPSLSAPLDRLGRLLSAAARALTDGNPEEALWALWDGSGWARRLEAESAQGGRVGERADRDLDAALALFGAAARLEERRPRAGVSALLEELAGQVIPAAPTEERAAAGGRVRLLTAHRSKGLEWDVVVVAGVQEGVWPDLRRRGSLLEADAVGFGELREPPTPAQLLTEERRLLYVALTRARRRLVLTAVSAYDDAEAAERPSRLLAELGLTVPERAEPPAPAGLLTTASLVARLRRCLQDDAAPPALRAAAAQRLARLARAGAGTPGGADRVGAWVPAADPATWWGLREPSVGTRPLVAEGEPLRLSGSAVQAHERCPLRWFLERSVGAAPPPGTAQGFGHVLHVIARAVGAGELPPVAADLEPVIDDVWPSLAHEADWESRRERREAGAAAERLVRFLAPRLDRPAQAEAGFDVEVADGVRVLGRVDRVEVDPEGRSLVIDWKTGASVASYAEAAENLQLAVYQLAVEAGAFPDVAPPGTPSAGAALVFLRGGDRAGVPKQRVQPPAGEPGGWAQGVVVRVAADVRAERHVARPGTHCERCPVRTSCPADPAGAGVLS